MKKKIVLLTLFSVFLLSAMTVPALQYDWDVGVEVGDTFRYVGTLHLWETENVEFPPTYLEFLQTYNESDWLEYAVTDIEALNVTFEVTTHWKDGNETGSTMEVDMAGVGPMPPMVIGANLTEGTEIHAAYTDPYFGIEYAARILNASVMREYFSGTREANVLIYNQTIFGNVFHYEYLWDKETGIQVYFQNSGIEVLNENYDWYSYNVTLELLETNIEGWTVIPEYPTWTVMLPLFIAITVSIALYKRKKLKH